MQLQCWLQECHISMSPVGDLIAIANGDRVVHFTRECTGIAYISFKTCYSYAAHQLSFMPIVIMLGLSE